MKKKKIYYIFYYLFNCIIKLWRRSIRLIRCLMIGGWTPGRSCQSCTLIRIRYIQFLNKYKKLTHSCSPNSMTSKQNYLLIKSKDTKKRHNIKSKMPLNQKIYKPFLKLILVIFNNTIKLLVIRSIRPRGLSRIRLIFIRRKKL